jgi:autotransporter-associated beta strand protein
LKSGGSPNTAGSFGVEVENNVTLGTDLSWNISNDGAANAPYLPALRSRSGANTVAGSILIQSGGGGARFVSDAGSALNLTGNVTTDVAGGRDLILDGAGSGQFSGLITNGTATTMFVNVSKEGAGTWTFSGTNDSGGRTILKAGTLLLTGMTGTNSLVASNSAVLRGTGIVRGAAVIDGTVAPGTVANMGTLTCSNTLELTGTTMLRLAKSPTPVCDRLQGMSAVTYGGSLVVTNTGGSLQLGDTFQLFSAGSYGGRFASLTLPSLPPGFAWSDHLALDGTLQVGVVQAPVLISSLVNGTNLSLSFASDLSVTYLLQQRDTFDAMPGWTAVSTNVGNGEVMVITVPVDDVIPSRFFRLLAY